MSKTLPTTKRMNHLCCLSPQSEAWVGFDQGWVNTSLTTENLYLELKESIRKKDKEIKSLYLGLFLQFKIVDVIRRKSRHMPNGYLTPYFRSELSLKPNERTGLSQHETLLVLNSIQNAQVLYACGMLFDISDVYSKPDINNLRLVPISSAPTGWNTNERHFITFQTQNDNNPLWCSKPSQGIAFGVQEWSKNQDYGPRFLTDEQLLALIQSSSNAIENHSKGELLTEQIDFFDHEFPEDVTASLPESFTIIEFRRRDSVA